MAGVARATALSMVALVAVGLTRLVHGSLVSHATDRATYGLVGSLLATVVVASLVLPGGASSAMAKFVAFHRGAGDVAAARAAHRFLTRLSVASAALLGLGAALIAARLYHLGWADTGAVGLLTVVYSLYTVDKAALYGFGRVAGYARLEIATSVLAIGATVLVVVLGWHGYLLPLALGYGLFVLGARALLHGTVRGERADRYRRGEILGYTALASIGTLAGAGFLQGTQLLAYWLVAPAQAAWFAAAVALVAPAYFLPRALGLALFPAMARAHGAGDTGAIRRQADLSTRALAVLLAPVFAVAQFLAPQVLVFFGGPGYAPGATVLRLMLATTYLGVVQVPAINALASGTRRAAWIPAVAATSGCLIGLATVAVLGPRLAATGVALGYLVGSAVTAGVPVALVWRAHGMRWAGPLTRSVGLVAAACAVGMLVPAGPADWAAAGGALLVALAVLHRDLCRLRRG